MTIRTARLLPVLVSFIAFLAFAPSSHAASGMPLRCDTPYSPDQPGVGHAGMVRAAPAIRWLRAVYGYEGDHVVRAGRRNVFRSLALRPCPLRRGAITVWSTNPPAMIRRAWRQPWIRSVDIQWVRVRYGGVDAIRAVQRATTPATLAAIEAELGGPLTTVGDDPHRDQVRLGIDADVLPGDADAIATRLLGVPTSVALEEPPSLA